MTDFYDGHKVTLNSFDLHFIFSSPVNALLVTELV